MIRHCPHCGAANRVPAPHLADHGRCGACRGALTAVAEPLAVDAAAFREVIDNAAVPVLVDFWAPWCGPCRMAAPEVARVAAALAGRALVLKVDIDQEAQLAAEFAVRSIPLFVVFRDGRERGRQVGLVGQRQLETMTLQHV